MVSFGSFASLKKKSRSPKSSISRFKSKFATAPPPAQTLESSTKKCVRWHSACRQALSALCRYDWSTLLKFSHKKHVDIHATILLYADSIDYIMFSTLHPSYTTRKKKCLVIHNESLATSCVSQGNCFRVV